MVLAGWLLGLLVLFAESSFATFTGAWCVVSPRRHSANARLHLFIPSRDGC
jgi:hypothetical protein